MWYLIVSIPDLCLLAYFVVASILSLFRNRFNKFNYTGARMLDPIHHMTLKLFCNRVFRVESSIVYQIYSTLIWASFHNVTKICKQQAVYQFTYIEFINRSM